MPSAVALSSKNQVVIPREARKKLGVEPGARLLGAGQGGPDRLHARAAPLR